MQFSIRSPLKWCGLALVLIVCGSAAATDDARRFYGYAFDIKGQKYLYTEVHEQKFEGDKWVGGRISYFAPDGSKLGQKTLDFSVDPFIPLYDYALPALGYREGITKIDSKTVLLSKTSDGKTRTKAIKKKAPISGDSGFHNFIRAHFKPLMAGETVPFTFIAAGNLDTFKFRAKRIEDGIFEGKKSVRFLVEIDSLLLRLIAPDLIVTYKPETEKLVRYEGPSNVINPDTDNVYNTRISYFSEPPPGAPENLPPLQ